MVIFRDQNGDVGAVEDRCCHRGAPLHLGKVMEKGLQCGYHGLTPETETSCFYFWSAANGYRQDDPSATEQLFSEIDTAFQQDKHVVQLQQERLAELGEGGLIDVVADSARIHMRRTVDRLIDEDRQRSADHKEAVAG